MAISISNEKWFIIEDGVLKGFSEGHESETDIVIPYGVTSIGLGAFCGRSSLTSVNIPNSVISIGYFAFYRCSSLTSVNIPNSVTSIGDHAFCECSSLTSVNIPNSVMRIGDWAFYICSSLTSVKIPNSVTSIGLGAFCGCSSLSIICEKGSYAEKYAKEHKITYKYATIQTKTKGQVFIELFPACKLCDLGIPDISPCDIDQRTNYTHCSCFDDCVKCMKAYWSEPIND